MGFALLTFLTVSLSIVVGYQLVSVFLSPNSEAHSGTSGERIRPGAEHDVGVAALSEFGSAEPGIDAFDRPGCGDRVSPRAAARHHGSACGLVRGAGLSWQPMHLFALMACLAGAPAW